MKPKIHIVFLAFLIPFYSNAQWFRQAPTPTYTDLYKIKFVTPDVGWTIGQHGYITKTTDGGESWFLQSCETWHRLNDIAFFNSETGIVVTSNGKIFKTSDGGSKWCQVYLEQNSESLSSISITENGSVFVVGEQGRILKSTNNGEDWIEFELGITHHFGDVKFFNDSVGLMIGEYQFNNYNDHSYQILMTTDTGQNWTVKVDSLENALNKIFITNDYLGYVVGDAGKILKTSNYGLDWDTLNSGTNKNLHDVYFLDDVIGFVVGDSGTILKTTNAGSSWFNVGASITQYSLKTIRFNDSSIGYTAGDRGQLLKTTDRGESWVLETKYQIGDVLGDLCFIDKDHGFAVGCSGTILYTPDGGKSWIRQQSEAYNMYLSRVIFKNKNLGFVMTYDNQYHYILKTTNSGTVWEKIQMDEIYNSLVFIDENSLVVVGLNGQIKKSTDCGISWNSLVSGTSKNLYDIKFVNQNIGYAVGDSGLVLKTLDGGQTWSEIYLQTPYLLYEIKFINEELGFIVGSEIYKTTNGGLDWEKLSLPHDNGIFFGIDFLDENNGIVVGLAWWGNPGIYSAGIILRTSDGGNNWTIDLPGAYENALGVSFVDENNIWIASGSGVLHTSNTGVTFVEEDNKKNIIPKDFILEQNYPNPFNPSTVIRYQLPVAGNVILKVYDVLGNEVATLVNEDKPAGNYEVDFNAKNLSSGVYFYKLQAGSFSQSIKMILLK